MKTLVITDLHLNNKIRGLLDAQCACLSRIFQEENPNEIIIMGDVFMSRKPSPSVLLGLKKLLDSYPIPIHIIRGNHDSETKADDGITALSLFQNEYVEVYNHTHTQWSKERVFIPHYENEQRIIEDLGKAPKDFIVFGHFGYNGSLNSAGDADFGMPLSVFLNTTYLGHIHQFSQRSVEHEGSVQTVTCLGTPYTTNFTEAGKGNYYAVIENGDVTFKEVTHGPRYVCISRNTVSEDLNDPNYFNIVRVYVDKLSDTEDYYIAKDIFSKYDVQYLEIKYKPVFDEEVETYYNPETNPFDLNRSVLEEYVNNTPVDLEKDKLLEGLDLINANK